MQHRISNLNFYCADRETACLPAAAAAAAGGVVGQVQASAAAWAAAGAAAINLLMKTGNKLGQLG